MSFTNTTDACALILPTNEKLVLIMLADHFNHETGQCNPSLTTLMRECGLTRPSVIKALKGLETNGFIEIKRSKNSKNNNLPNSYILHIPGKAGLLAGSKRRLPLGDKGSKGGLPGVVKDVYQGGKGDLLGGSKGRLPEQGIYMNKEMNKEVEQGTTARAKHATGKPKGTSIKFILDKYGITGQLADDFIVHRKTKRASITETVMAAYQQEAQKAGITLQEAVAIHIERGWQGMQADWLINHRAKSALNAERPLEPVKHSKITEQNIVTAQAWLEKKKNERNP